MTLAYAPGPRGSAIWGSLAEFRHDSPNCFDKMARQYGGIVHFRLASKHVHLITDPDYIHTILVDQPEKFPHGSYTRDLFQVFLGLSMFTTDGEYHRQQRKLAQPAFHYNRVKAYGDTMVQIVHKKTSHWQPGQIYDMDDLMLQMTLEIVTSTLFKTNLADEVLATITEMNGGIQNFVRQRRTSLINLPQWVPTATNRWFKDALEKADKIVMDTIEEHRASGADNGDVLSMLMMAEDEETGQRMTDAQLLAESKTILAAGHDTTGSGLGFVWYLLSQHPEVEAKLHAELDEVLGSRLPTMEDMPKLTYLNMIIKESMRIYPPASLINREPTEDVTFGGHLLRKGELILISPYALGRSPRFYDEPDCFKPERWADGLEKRLPRFTYIPFSSGPHVCIGQQFAMMEMTLGIATIAQHWRLETLPGYRLIPEIQMTLRPKGGLPMKVMARQ